LDDTSWVARVVRYSRNIHRVLEDSAIFKTIDLLSKLAILFAVISWWTERGARVDEANNRAWTLISVSKGIRGDLGRGSALKTLRDNEANLIGITLSGAELVLIRLEARPTQCELR
jgi:hypothetical protein